MARLGLEDDVACVVLVARAGPEVAAVRAVLDDDRVSRPRDPARAGRRRQTCPRARAKPTQRRRPRAVLLAYGRHEDVGGSGGPARERIGSSQHPRGRRHRRRRRAPSCTRRRRPRRSPREQRRRLSHEGSDGFPQHRGIVAAAVSAAPDTTQSAEATTACGCPLGGGVALRRRRPSAVLIGAGIVVGGVRRVGARVAVDVGGGADTGVGVAPAGRHLADGGSPR